MSELQRQVAEFHLAFDHPIADVPTIPSEARVRFRARLITEEFLETLESLFDMTEAEGSPGVAIRHAADTIRFVIDHARVTVDLVGLADGLADLDYVVEGTRLELGIDGVPIAAEVHRSNMAKKGGEKRPDGKSLKPPGWTPPDIAGELAEQANVGPHQGLRGLLAELRAEGR
jgi:predicted HAD superfamily Cof-like phosphohydrolase